MNNTLFDALETWLQGRINTCVMGLLDRVSRLEAEREDAAGVIRNQSQNIEKLYAELRTACHRVTELEDRLVEKAPDQVLEGFAERVYDCFDSNEFRDAARDVVEDYVNNRDDLASMDDVERFIENNVRIKVY